MQAKAAKVVAPVVGGGTAVSAQNDVKGDIGKIELTPEEIAVMKRLLDGGHNRVGKDGLLDNMKQIGISVGGLYSIGLGWCCAKKA